jgi:hypothetical protein
LFLARRRSRRRRGIQIYLCKLLMQLLAVVLATGHCERKASETSGVS